MSKLSGSVCCSGNSGVSILGFYHIEKCGLFIYFVFRVRWFRVVFRISCFVFSGSGLFCIHVK